MAENFPQMLKNMNQFKKYFSPNRQMKPDSPLEVM